MFSKNQKKFYGRRKGRRISLMNLKLLEDHSNKFYINEDQVFKLAPYENNKNILEIGFGNGDNLVNMSLNKPNDLFIGCDAYYNGCIKLLKQIIDKNINNVKIWPDDINLIMKKFKRIKGDVGAKFMVKRLKKETKFIKINNLKSFKDFDKVSDFRT